MYKQFLQRLRHLSTQCPTVKDNLKMKSWQIHEYGDLTNLQLGEARIPHIDSPHKVLVKVKAASVNPIDLAMIGNNFPNCLCVLHLSLYFYRGIWSNSFPNFKRK